MGRGLSPLQRKILVTLEQFQREPGAEDAHRQRFIGDMAAPSDIIRALGLDPTPANRAAMSRSLARLEARGLVTSYRACIGRPGNGSRYALG